MGRLRTSQATAGRTLGPPSFTSGGTFRNSLIFSFALLAFVSSACAADSGAPGRTVLSSVGEWATHGPGVGVVNDLAIDPSNARIIYAATGGGVFKSTDGGASWAAVTDGLGGPDVTTLAVNPSAPSTLYAATSQGVFKSIDAGASWTLTTAGLEMFGGEVVVAPMTPMTVYATRDCGSIIKSTDGGETWVDLGVGEGGQLTIDPSNPTTLYTWTSPCGENEPYVLKSNDGGSSWTGFNGQLKVFPIAYDPSTPSTAYGVSPYANQLFKSTDDASSWTPLSLGANAGYVRVVAIAPMTPSTLYVTTRNGATGVGSVLRSTDAGATWSPADTGLGRVGINDLVIDPEDDSTMYAATSVGSFKSTNEAASWVPDHSGLVATYVKVIAIDPEHPSIVYATGDGRLYVSRDGGLDWRRVSRRVGAPVYSLVIDPVHPRRLYVATLRGVRKSTDGGTTWIPAGHGLHHLNVDTLAIDPVHPHTLYASTFQVFKTTDAGANWAPTALSLSAEIVSLAIDSAHPRTLYAGSFERGRIFKSTDGGVHWSRLDTGLRTGVVDALVVDPLDPSIVYAGVGTECIGCAERGEVLKTIDGGRTWQQAKADLPAGYVTLAIDPVAPETLYVGTYGEGVFETTDAGATWTPKNDGLTNEFIVSLAIDPIAGTALHAGAAGGGEFELVVG